MSSRAINETEKKHAAAAKVKYVNGLKVTSRSLRAGPNTDTKSAKVPLPDQREVGDWARNLRSPTAGTTLPNIDFPISIRPASYRLRPGLTPVSQAVGRAYIPLIGAMAKTRASYAAAQRHLSGALRSDKLDVERIVPPTRRTHEDDEQADRPGHRWQPGNRRGHLA
ncbi:hypothetical protein ABZT28_23175 [Streptomyces sp. NPDC005388]|uniref:hypothetical protein n=1 Tax=Streptomyces sp. NPDC005388 TaxID=3156717 RepID=UPI00339E8D82